MHTSTLAVNKVELITESSLPWAMGLYLMVCKYSFWPKSELRSRCFQSLKFKVKIKKKSIIANDRLLFKVVKVELPRIELGSKQGNL
jgi:hypothetical protein